MKKIAVLSLKGGVGKTTLSTNLGAALCNKGHRVLLIDMDPQNSLTETLGQEPATIKGIEFLLTGDLRFYEVLKCYDQKIDFLPSGKRLKDLEIWIATHHEKDPRFTSLLTEALENFQNRYDYIIIDCPPHAGLLNYNALSYANHLVIPVQCQHMGVEGARRTIYFFHKIKSRYNPDLKISALVPVMHDGRNKVSGMVVDELSKSFDGLLTKTMIRVNVSLAEAPAFQKTIFDYKPSSRGAKDFSALADEIERML
jgi:chromosome partitioning protein